MTFASLPYRIMAGLQSPGVRADPRARRRLLRAARGGRVPARLGRGRIGPVHEVPAPGVRATTSTSAPRSWWPSGEIKLQPGQVDHLTEDAVVMADGTELPADLVVYATGYESMNGFVADLISQEVADKVGKVWGLGSGTTKDPGPWEGEQRNMWKPTQQAGAVVPRRQPAPVAPLLAVPRAPAQGARRGHRHARLRATGGASHAMSGRRSVAGARRARAAVERGAATSGSRRAYSREQRVADVVDAHARRLVRDRAGRGRVPVEPERGVHVLEHGPQPRRGLDDDDARQQPRAADDPLRGADQLASARAR